MMPRCFLNTLRRTWNDHEDERSFESEHNHVDVMTTRSGLTLSKSSHPEKRMILQRLKYTRLHSPILYLPPRMRTQTFRHPYKVKTMTRQRPLCYLSIVTRHQLLFRNLNLMDEQVKDGLWFEDVEVGRPNTSQLIEKVPQSTTKKTVLGGLGGLALSTFSETIQLFEQTHFDCCQQSSSLFYDCNMKSYQGWMDSISLSNPIVDNTAQNPFSFPEKMVKCNTGTEKMGIKNSNTNVLRGTFSRTTANPMPVKGPPFNSEAELLTFAEYHAKRVNLKQPEKKKAHKKAVKTKPKTNAEHVAGPVDGNNNVFKMPTPVCVTKTPDASLVKKSKIDSKIGLMSERKSSSVGQQSDVNDCKDERQFSSIKPIDKVEPKVVIIEPRTVSSLQVEAQSEAQSQKFVSKYQSPNFVTVQFETNVSLNPSQKSFDCNECDKLFFKHSAYVAHTRVHQKPSNKCSVCSKTFSRSWLLKGHMRTHTGERPYKCEHPGCDKAFADRSNLRSHAMIHTTNAKNFVCIKCNRAFAQKRYLHKHQLEVCRLI